MLLAGLCGCASPQPGVRPAAFEFGRDTFAYRNELIYTYGADPKTGKLVMTRREPAPEYVSHCFGMVRVTRQFYDHARFEPSRPPPDEKECRTLVRRVLARSPSHPSPPEERIVIPGYQDFHAFSQAQEHVLKDACGGAWRSYFLRSHWRVVFPFTRGHQQRMAQRLQRRLRERGALIVHVMRFPALTINHGLLVYAAEADADGVTFRVYDPNDALHPTCLRYDAAQRTFTLPPNEYWLGGRVDVTEIYRHVLF